MARQVRGIKRGYLQTRSRCFRKNMQTIALTGIITVITELKILQVILVISEQK
jgi:hypothetical protein